MTKSKFSNGILIYVVIGSLIGIFIGHFMKGGFNLASFIGVLTVVIILITIDIINNRRKKDVTPDFDERTTNNILKFYAYASNGFIFISILVFSIVPFKGMETISVDFLLIALFLYFSLSGVTAFIISRK